MLRFTAVRLLLALVTIVLVVTFAFVVLRVSGDPAQIIMGADAPPEAVDAFRTAWGLDESLWVQYLSYFGAIFSGDLGRSMRDGRDAITLVTERIPATLALTVPALIIKLALGIPAGILAALHRNSIMDRMVMVFAVAGFTIPSFVLGLLLVLVFAVNLGWLPSGGQESWRHAILPVITLGVGGAAVLARFTRSAMLEVLGQPYIRTASAKGVAWRLVVSHPALPNAAIPTVTIIASTLIVSMTLAFPEIILLESGLSFLGLGVQPPATSLGNMVGFGREYLTRAAWIMLAPAIVIVLTTLSVSLIGDWLRDRLDPTLS